MFLGVGIRLVLKDTFGRHTFWTQKEKISDIVPFESCVHVFRCRIMQDKNNVLRKIICIRTTARKKMSGMQFPIPKDQSAICKVSCLVAWVHRI